MKSGICTLYEGNYHYGVAALINSLHRFGYTGDVFVGYRGPIAPWIAQFKETEPVKWKNARSFSASENLRLHFLPIEIGYHFANHKPDFLIDLWSSVIPDADYMYYFDPDITNKCDWDFYELWAEAGVAIVHEITHNDMPANHPKRHQWLDMLRVMGKEYRNKLNSYINSGFIGVKKANLHFLHTWKDATNTAAQHFGYDKTKFAQSPKSSAMFRMGDQDLLNIAAMCTEAPLSECGPEAMDFISAGWVMSHTTGSPKSWNKNFFSSLLDGYPPTNGEKEYWNNVNGLIKTVSPGKLKRKKLVIKIASLLGRFYRRY